MSSGTFAAPVGGAGYVGLKSNASNVCPAIGSIGWTKKIVSNGSKTHCMNVELFTIHNMVTCILSTWNPINNKKFETLSYLPPLSDDSIAKQIDYMLHKGWTPCIEFDEVGCIRRENSQMPGYYDGRYWTLWKLPMFGCIDSSQVLKEIHECKRVYTQMHLYDAWHLTTSATCSPWLLSFTNLPPLEAFCS